MNIIPLFPIPLGQVSNFITDTERLELIEVIKNAEHVEHRAILGDGFSTWSRVPSTSNEPIKDRLEHQVNNYAPGIWHIT